MTEKRMHLIHTVLLLSFWFHAYPEGALIGQRDACSANGLGAFRHEDAAM